MAKILENIKTGLSKTGKFINKTAKDYELAAEQRKAKELARLEYENKRLTLMAQKEAKEKAIRQLRAQNQQSYGSNMGMGNMFGTSDFFGLRTGYNQPIVRPAVKRKATKKASVKKPTRKEVYYY